MWLSNVTATVLLWSGGPGPQHWVVRKDRVDKATRTNEFIKGGLRGKEKGEGWKPREQQQWREQQRRRKGEGKENGERDHLKELEFQNSFSEGSRIQPCQTLQTNEV